LTRQAVATLRPLIQRVVDDLLDRVEADGHMDVIADLAYPLPAGVIGELLGVPASDRDQLKKWSDEFVGFFKSVPSQTTIDDYRRADQAAQELERYFRGVLARRRGHDANGLLDALARAEDAGDRLSGQELAANAILILHAGHETTTHLIGNGLLALLRHPDQFQKLCANLDLVPSAIEESLRFDSPLQLTYRMASQDFKLGGKPIRRGQVVHLVLAAANRDPAQFSNADELDVGRSPNEHVAFGHGPHYCLGAYLARLEAQIAVESVLQRFPIIRLGPGPFEHQEHFILRGLKSLPVRWSDAGKAASA
jgi:hypothetical protein